LYEAIRHGKVQLLDIFCEEIIPDLLTRKDSNIELPMPKMTSWNLSSGNSGTGRTFIAQALDTVRYGDRNCFQNFGWTKSLIHYNL
jgi:origin recognition complex subunit 3